MIVSPKQQADTTASIWRPKTGSSWDDDPPGGIAEAVRLRGAHREGLNDAVWAKDGSYCVTASDDKTLWLWDVETGRPALSFEGHESYVFCCDLNGRNTLIASGSFDETVKLWDVRCARCVSSLVAHSEPVTGVAFDPANGTMLVTSSYDGLVRLWDVASGQCLASMFAELEEVTSCRHAPVLGVRLTKDGRHALTSHRDDLTRLWRVDEAPCRHVRTFAGRVAGTRCCAATFVDHGFNDRGDGDDDDVSRGFPARRNAKSRKDGLLGGVVAGSDDGRVLVWDAQTQQVAHDFTAHADAVRRQRRVRATQTDTHTHTSTDRSIAQVLAVDAHPTEPLLATGGATADRLVKLWRLSSSSEVVDESAPPEECLPRGGAGDDDERENRRDDDDARRDHRADASNAAAAAAPAEGWHPAAVDAVVSRAETVVGEASSESNKRRRATRETWTRDGDAPPDGAVSGGIYPMETSEEDVNAPVNHREEPRGRPVVGMDTSPDAGTPEPPSSAAPDAGDAARAPPPASVPGPAAGMTMTPNSSSMMMPQHPHQLSRERDAAIPGGTVRPSSTPPPPPPGGF